MRAKQICALTKTESRAKTWRLQNAFEPPPPHPTPTRSLGYCPFKGNGSVVVALLFYVPPIVYRGSVSVFILVRISLCPF